MVHNVPTGNNFVVSVNDVDQLTLTPNNINFVSAMSLQWFASDRRIFNNTSGFIFEVQAADTFDSQQDIFLKSARDDFRSSQKYNRSLRLPHSSKAGFGARSNLCLFVRKCLYFHYLRALPHPPSAPLMLSYNLWPPFRQRYNLIFHRAFCDKTLLPWDCEIGRAHV